MPRVRPLVLASLLLALPVPAAAQAPAGDPPQPGAAPPAPTQPAPPPGPPVLPPGATPPAPPQPSAPPPPQLPQPAYPQPGAPQPAYPQPAYPQPGAPQPGAPQPGAPQPAYPQPGAPQPASPQPGAPQPAYPQPYPQPGYPQPGYPQPGYPQPGGYDQQGYPIYPPGYGYVPPRPPAPKPKDLRWSLRFDPFDLVLRRLTFQAEIAVAGPFAIEVAPSWIFGSPYAGIDEKGFTIAGNAVFYISGQAFRGLWLKAHFAYENFTAVFTHPVYPAYASDPTRARSALLGLLFGDTFVVPRNGGFALSAGFGFAVATAPELELVAAKGTSFAYSTTLYNGFDRVRLLGSLSLGVAF